VFSSSFDTTSTPIYITIFSTTKSRAKMGRAGGRSGTYSRANFGYFTCGSGRVGSRTSTSTSTSTAWARVTLWKWLSILVLIRVWMRMWDHCFTFLTAGKYDFLRYIVIHQGATLQRPYQIRFYTTYVLNLISEAYTAITWHNDRILSHHRATMQRPWRSLRSLSALALICH